MSDRVRARFEVIPGKGGHYALASPGQVGLSKWAGDRLLHMTRSVYHQYVGKLVDYAQHMIDFHEELSINNWKREDLLGSRSFDTYYSIVTTRKTEEKIKENENVVSVLPFSNIIPCDAYKAADGKEHWQRDYQSYLVERRADEPIVRERNSERTGRNPRLLNNWRAFIKRTRAEGSRRLGDDMAFTFTVSIDSSAEYAHFLTLPTKAHQIGVTNKPLTYLWRKPPWPGLENILFVSRHYVEHPGNSDRQTGEPAYSWYRAQVEEADNKYLEEAEDMGDLLGRVNYAVRSGSSKFLDESTRKVSRAVEMDDEVWEDDGWDYRDYNDYLLDM